MDTPERDDDPLLPPDQQWQPTAEMFAAIQSVATRHAKVMIGKAKEKGDPVPDNFSPEYLGFAINVAFQLATLGMATDRMASAIFMDWFFAMRMSWQGDAIRDAVLESIRDAGDGAEIAEAVQAIGKDLGIDMKATEMTSGRNLAEF